MQQHARLPILTYLKLSHRECPRDFRRCGFAGMPAKPQAATHQMQKAHPLWGGLSCCSGHAHRHGPRSITGGTKPSFLLLPFVAFSSRIFVNDGGIGCSDRVHVHRPAGEPFPVVLRSALEAVREIQHVPISSATDAASV